MAIVERWLPIKGLEPYEVSDEGRFRRVYKNGKIKYLKIYRKYHDPGAIAIKIYKEQNPKKLVWETFKGPVPKGYFVMSKNGMVTATAIYDLELVPIGKFVSEAAKTRGKLVRDKNTGKIYKGARAAAKALYCSPTTVCEACNKKYKNPSINVEYVTEVQNV